jgi:hypothetical protein
MPFLFCRSFHLTLVPGFNINVKIFLFLTSVLLVTGCSAQAVSESESAYPLVYRTLSENHEKVGSDGAEKQNDSRQKFADFIKAHADLKAPDMAQRIEAAYAEELYFNDTLKTLTSRDSLVDYLTETAERVDYNRVQIQEIVNSGDNYYVRWTMQTGFTVFGKSIETDSIGMTHIRLDDQGKINFHQDFWDNTEGFFRHLPVVGYFIGKTKQRL